MKLKSISFENHKAFFENQTMQLRPGSQQWSSHHSHRNSVTEK
jgi:hypothetical protein